MSERQPDPTKYYVIQDKIFDVLNLTNKGLPDERWDGLFNIVDYLCIDMSGYKPYHWSEHIDD